MTWEKFKKQRYKLMEDSMDTMAYLDSDSLVKEYVNALKADAANQDNNVTASTNVRRINYHKQKRVTDNRKRRVNSYCNSGGIQDKIDTEPDGRKYKLLYGKLRVG